MHIRKAGSHEWPELQLLNNEVFIDNAQYDPDIIKDWALTEAGERYFKELVLDPERLCLVAEHSSGQLVGYLAASPKEFSYRKSKYLEVDNMGVHPDFRSQGIGAQLMAGCKDWALEQGYQKLIVVAYFENEKAVAFYQKCGFYKADVSLEMELGDGE